MAPFYRKDSQAKGRTDRDLRDIETQADQTSEWLLAASMKALTFAWSFIPGDASTPLETSTPYGRTRRTASATFSGVSPPARKIGLPILPASRARSQLNVSPVPPALPVENASSSHASVSYVTSESSELASLTRNAFMLIAPNCLQKAGVSLP